MTDEKPKQPWTPEPWEMTSWDVEIVNGEERGGEGYSIEATRPYRYLAEVQGVDEESQANGRLMARAPALAKCLAKFVLGYEDALRRRGDRTASEDPPVIAAARAELDLCGWRWS